MPSESKMEEWSCPKCQKRSQYQYWFKVSADESPALREQVLSGDFFEVNCEGCGLRGQVMPEMRYVDYPGKFLVYLVQLKMLEQSSEFINTLPLLRRFGTRIHVVHTVADLQSIILAYERGNQPPETEIAVPEAAKAQFNDMNRRMAELEEAMSDPSRREETIKAILRGNRKKHPRKKRKGIWKLFSRGRD
jgi:hypothetical protein